MSNFQGVVFHRPVDLLAVGGRGEDGAEDASASLADLSRRCILVHIGAYWCILVLVHILNQHDIRFDFTG